MAAQPDVLLHCFNNASSAAQPALQRCIDQAVAELQLLETQAMKVAERDELSASWRYLLANKSVWSERYAHDLLAEFTKNRARQTLSRSSYPSIHTLAARCFWAGR